MHGLLPHFVLLGNLARTVARLGNQRVLPLRIVARSLSWLMTMAKKKQWAEERTQRRLVDVTVAIKVLKLMTSMAPPPTYSVNPLVKLAFVDQTCTPPPSALADCHPR